jgi:hypothetical protein
MVRSRVAGGGYALDVHVERVIGMTIEYSTGTIVEQLVLGVVFGALGYMFSERYRRARGVTPWKIPAPVWALLLFLSWEIFSVLYLIAYFTTRPRTGPTGWTAGDGQGWGPGPRDPGGPPAGWHPPAGDWGAPRPSQGWDAPAPGQWEAPAPGHQGAPPPGGWDAPPQPGTAFPAYPGPGQAGPGPMPAPPPPPPTPRAWLADPGGRHELRYWDGTKFTEHVADGGKITVDPL